MPYKKGNRPRMTTVPMSLDRTERLQAAVEKTGLESRTHFIITCVERELAFLGFGKK